MPGKTNNAKTETKILLADDHALFRAGMRHVLARLQEEVDIVEAGDYEEVLSQAAAPRCYVH